ncbi:hypothetical protein H0H93_005995 [Arthromyces matolae]|nr:hypothetical protein H0H93_005995 [Arthromyces matolae]
MVLTHRIIILSAYVLLTFLATATPIPISLQLLPRSLPELHSDPLLTLEPAVSSSLAPGGQARDTSKAMRHISPHNSQMFPQEARTTVVIERRMEGSGS